MPQKQFDYENSVVRIRTEHDIFGAGFMISDYHLLTCCHVLTYYDGKPEGEKEQPKGTITVDFPLCNPGMLTYTKIVFWNYEKDIAILKIADGDEYPLDADYSMLHIKDNQMNDEYEAFGFPIDSPDGVYSDGRILKSNASGWYQIEKLKTEGKPVVQGFSGAPLWNKNISKVVGMVVASDLNQEAKVAYFIPTQKIIEIIPEDLMESTFQYLKERQTKQVPDSSYEEVKEAFEGLNFDNEQEDIFKSHLRKEKFFAFIIHGKDEEYGQKWLYNRLIRRYRLSQKEIIPYLFKGVSNGRTLKDFKAALSVKLKILGRPDANSIVKRLLKYLHSRDVIFIIKSPLVKPIKNILLPFCEKVLNEINTKSPKNKLIFFIHIEEEMEKREQDDLIVWNEPLPIICNERFKSWINLLSTDIYCPLISEHYETECLIKKGEEELDEECKKILSELIKVDIEDDIPYQFDEECLIEPEIPAGRFMKETVNNLQLSWQKFEEKWIRY